MTEDASNVTPEIPGSGLILVGFNHRTAPIEVRERLAWPEREVGQVTVDRFRTPLYSAAEASRYLGVPDSTFRAWASGYTNRVPGRSDVHGSPIVTTSGVYRAKTQNRVLVLGKSSFDL